MKKPTSEATQKQTLDLVHGDLNRIADTAYSILWLGESLKELNKANSLNHGILLIHAANAIMKSADEAVVHLSRVGGGAA